MLILIHDASVLIDLISVNLLEDTLSLPYIMETTDFVKREIFRNGQVEVIDRIIAAQKINVLRSSKEELAAISELHSQIPALSIADCSVLFHATTKGAVVLSGDMRLRKAAKAHSLSVCGTLWIFDKLVEYNLLSESNAVVYLERLMMINPRLPRIECLKRIDNWMLR